MWAEVSLNLHVTPVHLNKSGTSVLWAFTHEPDVESFCAISSHLAVGCDPQEPEDVCLYKSFCEVRAMFIVGIDIAKRNHEAIMIDQNGQIIGKPLSFSNSQAGYQKLMNFLRSNAGEDAQIAFGMEATGHYWLALYTHLRRDGFSVNVINAMQSDALREMYIRKTKNDTRDSFIIAEVIRFGRYCKTEVEDGDIYALRELCRQRFYIVDMISDLKRKVIALLDQIFPEYEKLFTDTFGASSLELLSEHTSPEEILALDTDDLVDLLAKASRGRLGLQKAEQIQLAARNSFGILLAQNTFALIVRQYIEQIKSFEKSIAAFDAEIERLLAPFDSKLDTITGIGSTLAAVILSEIGDIKRFDSPAKLAAFAGIDPSLKQSGDFTGSRAKMSKRGSPYLRRAIWLASVSAAFKDPAIHALYEKKIAEGKSHMTTMGHICRKLTSIIFAVMRDNKPYSPVMPADS